jgi:hypothetical protein
MSSPNVPAEDMADMTLNADARRYVWLLLSATDVALRTLSTSKPEMSNLGRDSPIVKHYSSTKNPCFVTHV